MNSTFTFTVCMYCTFTSTLTLHAVYFSPLLFQTQSTSEVIKALSSAGLGDNITALLSWDDTSLQHTALWPSISIIFFLVCVVTSMRTGGKQRVRCTCLRCWEMWKAVQWVIPPHTGYTHVAVYWNQLLYMCSKSVRQVPMGYKALSGALVAAIYVRSKAVTCPKLVT